MRGLNIIRKAIVKDIGDGHCKFNRWVDKQPNTSVLGLKLLQNSLVSQIYITPKRGEPKGFRLITVYYKDRSVLFFRCSQRTIMNSKLKSYFHTVELELNKLLPVQMND